MTAAPSSTTASESARRVFMILSPHSLPYARGCVRSLFANSAETLDLCFMTDSPDDRRILHEALAATPNPAGHRFVVVDDNDAEQRSRELWGDFPNLQAFRRGHPCWRKITDPLLFTRDREEIVILDPDLYFPNRFTFEPTPFTGVLLMWQHPDCMLPPQTVRGALHAGIPLARHVDIGVGAWRGGTDLGWLDWLIGRLGGSALPRIPHVESLVWSALARRLGGGYLDPGLWHCWRRSQLKRILLKGRVPGVTILRVEAFARMKCFHAGGEAKWWLEDAARAGLFTAGRGLTEPSPVIPFVALTTRRFEAVQMLKRTLAKTGYYVIFGATP